MTLFQASLADSIASVTWIGTTADTSTNINLRGMAGNATLRWVVARGFWSEMDGGGGLFAWDPTVIGTDDGGTVIVPDAGGSVTGCWRRVYSGPMDVRWFGCKCDGATDDAAILEQEPHQIPPILPRVGQVLGARGLTSARHILLPAALPGYIAGCKQGWAFSWRSLMAACHRRSLVTPPKPPIAPGAAPGMGT